MNASRIMAVVSLMALAAITTHAHAWGDTGHEVVCEIAFQELQRDIRREVGRLIHSDPDYPTFSAACNWADEPRKREIEHYINVTRSHRAITVDECPLASRCLFPAINNDTDTLSGRLSDDDEKLAALKFLGHWVGDIHQPFHVSFQDDRGANSIRVVGLCEGNLHGTWDGCIVGRELGDNSRAIADRLRKEITATDRTAWMHDSPVEWANESYQLTQTAAIGYCHPREGACWYEPDNMILSGDEKPRTMTVDQAYIDAHLPTIELRLKQAGVRLGALLNRALRDSGQR